jgi:hypothetical protein
MLSAPSALGILRNGTQNGSEPFMSFFISGTFMRDALKFELLSNFFSTSSLSLFVRKYAEAFQARARERAAFYEAFASRYGRRATIHYPIRLNRLLEFTEWLKEEVAKAMQSNDKPMKDVYKASRLPERVAMGYKAIYVYGMHLRIWEAEEDKVTCVSGVAVAVWEYKRSRDYEAMDNLDSAENVGWVEEILELNYRSPCCIVVLCSWIPGTLGIRNAKEEKDRYSFLLGNFNIAIHVGPKSFVFPTQYQQVVFSNDENWNANRGGDWKAICSTEVLGKLGNLDLYCPNI